MNTLRHWTPRVFYGVYRWLGVPLAGVLVLAASRGRWGEVVLDAVLLLAWLDYLRHRADGEPS